MVEKRGARGLTSDEHFTVDGTLLEAWAGAKSFQPEGKNTPPPEIRAIHGELSGERVE